MCLNFCDILRVIPLFTVMDAALHALLGLNEQVGAPWPHQQRELLQMCIQILDETRVQQLQSEAYPSPQQFRSDCCADAAALLELMMEWSCDWRVVYGAVKMAAAGLYIHPDLKQVEVAGVPVKGMVDAIRDYISKRGFALGRLDAAEQGVYEDWGETEHPMRELLLDRPEINLMCRRILREFFEEPQCGHESNHNA
jgi:hypothetical protein